MRWLTLILAAASVAACGEMRWSKPGADSDALARDQASCRAAARDNVLRRYGPPTPAQRPDARFGPETSLPGPADRQMLEQQAFDRCMRDRGYALERAGS
ncbi:MAG: hypothetical protein AB1452_00720 [Pseudomonadota bacterium]